MKAMVHQKIGITILLYFMMPNIAPDILWPNMRSSFLEGQLYLAGFFPVHKPSYKRVCGEIEEEGLQQLVSFLFTVNEVNKNKSLLRNIKLGALGLDSCYSQSHTLEVAMAYIHALAAAKQGIQNSLQCNIGTTNINNFSGLIGIIGGRSSDVSIQLANLMRIFQIPQVSYKSTSPVLSNKKLYKYFFRTVPSLIYQAEGLVQVVKSMKWKYVSVVYSDSHYGNAGFENLQKSAARNGICFATVQRVDHRNFNDSYYDDVVVKLLNVTATAVILFAEPFTARNIIAAAKRKNEKRFVWLGSESWSNRELPIKDQEFAEGTLSVSYVFHPSPDVYDYFKSLTPENSKETYPWFYEFWESKKQCRLPDFRDTPYNQNFTRNCTDSIPHEEYMQGMPSAQLVRDAVYSFAHALDNIYREKCPRRRGICQNMRKLDGEMIRKHLLNVTFHSGNGNLFHFDSNGDVPPRFNIVNFQRGEDGKYYWKIVGNFTKNRDSIIKLDTALMKFKHDRKEFPESVCSAPCSSGETKVLLDSMKCCWTCFNCTDREFISEGGECKECDGGFTPSSNKTFCEKIPETCMNYRHPWALGCLSFAALGILITVAVSVTFWKYWETPIIKASARELSALLLLGIFLSFGLTFFIVNKPSTVSCALVRFFLGFNYTVCYAAIVVKTRRIACIFERRARNRSPKYTSPQSQLTIVAALVSIEVVLIGIFMYEYPEFPTHDKNILICGGSNRPSYLLGLLYPFLLMILCTVYAFKTRKCPDGFNEARHITFTNYVTCVIWLAFLPTFTLYSGHEVRTITLSLLLSLSGAAQIAGLFMPKLYIAILQPQNNTKDIVMGHGSGTYSGTTSS